MCSFFNFTKLQWAAVCFVLPTRALASNGLDSLLHLAWDQQIYWKHFWMPHLYNKYIHRPYNVPYNVHTVHTCRAYMYVRVKPWRGNIQGITSHLGQTDRGRKLL